MSQELFERFVGAAGVDRPAKAAVLPVGCRRATDRRVAARVAFGKRAQIRRDAGGTAGKWATVVVKDISQGGIGFLSDDSVPIGETFVVRLPQRDGRLARIRCTVRRCEPGGFGGVAFLVGATFEQVIEEPSIRVNDDEQHPAQWDESPDGAPAGVATGGQAEATPKRPGGGFVRAAAAVLKAIDPLNWTRRNDDFSSN